MRHFGAGRSYDTTRVTTAVLTVQQQAAQADLDKLLLAQEKAESAAAAAQALNDGETTSPLVYVGMGVGALALLGLLAVLLKRRRGAKLRGYRRRRRR